MSQTSYAVNMAAAIAGMPADMGNRDVLSYVTPVDSIPFGLFVARVSGQDNQCQLPASSGADIVGIALIAVKEQALNTGVAQHVAGDVVSVLRRGRVWMTAEQSVTPADPVFVRYAAGGGGSQLGSARKDVDTASAVAFPKARFLSTATAGQLVLVEINI